MPIVLLQFLMWKGLQKCKLFYFCQWEIKLLLQNDQSQAGSRLGIACSIQKGSWHQGLERSPSLCIVWGFLLLKDLSAILHGTQKQQKGIKPGGCASQNFSFQGGVCELSFSHGHQTSVTKKSKAERAFRMFCKTKKNPWGLADGGVQLLLYCSHRSNTSKKVQPSPKEQATETFCSKDTNQKLRVQDLAAADFWETGKHPSGYTSFPEQSLIWHSQGCRTKRSLNRGLFLGRLYAAGLNMTCSNCHGWHEAAPWPLSTAAMKLAQLGNLNA